MGTVCQYPLHLERTGGGGGGGGGEVDSYLSKMCNVTVVFFIPALGC